MVIVIAGRWTPNPPCQLLYTPLPTDQRTAVEMVHRLSIYNFLISHIITTIRPMHTKHICVLWPTHINTISIKVIPVLTHRQLRLSMATQKKTCSCKTCNIVARPQFSVSCVHVSAIKSLVFQRLFHISYNWAVTKFCVIMNRTNYNSAWECNRPARDNQSACW